MANLPTSHDLNNVTALPCEMQLIWRCLPDSRSHATHQPALVRATHLLLGKTIITSVIWTLQTRHTVDRGDVDTYFVMYRVQ